MKKLFLLLAFTSIFYVVGCSNDTENNNTSTKTNSNSELETILLIPSKNGTADESLAKSIPKTTAAIFPYFLYTTAECKIPTSDIENNSQLYYNATNTTEEEINTLFGSETSSISKALSRAAETTEETISELYIIGDLSLTNRYSNSLSSDEQSLMYKEMTKNSNGTFSYEFTYNNNMKAWGNGNGNASFKFVTNTKSDSSSIWYGQTSVFESGIYYLAKPHTTEKYDKNILLTALKDGNTYKLVVTNVTSESLIFYLEGELSETPTLLTGPFIRGIPTADTTGDWQYVKLSENEDGSYYYDFTYSTDMEDKTTSCSIVFSIMPTNAYSLGSFGGEALSGGGELSNTIASFSTTNTSECNSVNTVYSSQENHNIILKNLEDCYKYRINVSTPSAAKIEDNVYTLTFTKLEKDENVTPGISFYGLTDWQCRGTFNGWGYTKYNENGEYWYCDPDDTTLMLNQVTGKTGEYTFTFTATSETEEFKIAYGDWNRALSGVSLSASDETEQTMNTAVEDSTISGLTVGTKYTLTFNCTETTKINNPGTVTVKIAKATEE